MEERNVQKGGAFKIIHKLTKKKKSKIAHFIVVSSYIPWLICESTILYLPLEVIHNEKCEENHFTGVFCDI